MTCSSDSVFVCSRSLMSWATSRPRVARWASTARPITRLKAKVDRWGLEALNVRERRRPRMPNELGPHLEQRIIAFSLGHPGYGPRRISAELARPKWGGIRVSEHGVWRVLVRVGLNTRNKRLALIARHRDPYEHRPEPPPPERHIDASLPGEKVQLDCFFIGRLAGTKGTVWQYTAIDVASAYCWAELHTSARNCTPQRATHAPGTRANSCTASPQSSPPQAGNSARHHRQRLGVPRRRVRRRAAPPRRPPALHPRRAAQQQRLRRTRPTHHP
jgi:hypothetical protein